MRHVFRGLTFNKSYLEQPRKRITISIAPSDIRTVPASIGNEVALFFFVVPSMGIRRFFVSVLVRVSD